MISLLVPITTRTATEASTSGALQTTKASACHKLLVAQLKARRWVLPADVDRRKALALSIRITLPVTCAFIPRGLCIDREIYSCNPCDKYHLVMAADSSYRGKHQQEFSHRLKCQCPNKSLLSCSWCQEQVHWKMAKVKKEKICLQRPIHRHQQYPL
jgi:hypothetical protein